MGRKYIQSLIKMNNKNIINTAKKVISTEIEGLKKLSNSINISFSQAVNAISNNRGRIVCCGVGKSAKILEKISSTLSSIGIASFTLDPTDAGHGSLGAIQKGDILIIASFSGNSSELHNILQYAKKIKSKVIGISSNSKSHLIKLSNIKIIMPKVAEAGNKNLDMIPTSSSTNLLALGDCIAISLATKKHFNKKKFGDLHPSGSLGKNLSEISKVMIVKRNIPFVYENSSIQETVIKITSGRLGCVIVVNKRKKICGFVSDGDISRSIKKFKNIFAQKAKDIMSGKPQKISSSYLITEALELMNKKKITALLVTKDKKLFGLVHMHDILSFLNS
jgi:arabinose-5-phosphate isomerase